MGVEDGPEAAEADLAVRDPTAGETGKGEAEQAEPSGEKKQLWTQLSGYVGRDVLSLMSLPIWLMEPTTTLQKPVETFEFHHLLDRAAKSDDPDLRLALVAAFACAAYAGVERTFKPFNPILGETFQLAHAEGAFHLLAEQVSHHPPISVTHAKGDGWSYQLTSKPKTKFLGNSVEVYPVGRTRLHLSSHSETYYILPPTTKAHNILIGSTWVDTYGTLEARLVGGDPKRRCTLNLAECGWFGADRYVVKGNVFEADGTCKLAIDGKWNFGLDAYACDPATGAKDGHPTPLYRCSPMPGDDLRGKYNFTRYARSLNEMPDASAAHQSPLLATDARIRPDRWHLDAGNDKAASDAKAFLETQQRAEAATRKEKGTTWAPRHFAVITDEAEANVQPDEPPFADIPMYRITSKPEAPHEAVPSKVAGAPQANGLPPAFRPWEFTEGA